ncbi:hypothetical protein D3C76_1074330 [compost metagenome]
MTGSGNAKIAGTIKMNSVREGPVQLHPRSNGNHPAFAVIRPHADLGDDVAGGAVFLVLVFQLDHGLAAVLGMDLSDHDLAAAGHLIDHQTCP